MLVLSILLILISSYLFLCIIKKKENVKAFNGFLYFLLIAFSQIVLSFEILSLLKQISSKGILILNVIFFIISLVLFIKKGKNFYIPELKTEWGKIFFSLKRDKLIGFLSVCFILFLIFQFIMAAFFPVTFGDSLTYYLPRCTSWIQNGSINHFITPDTRELIMPVNMEFLYTWVLLFNKSERGIALFSFISYIGAIYVIYNFLKELGYSVRRRLWTIFVFSSFALIMIEMYTPTADLFIGTLILAGVFLFYKASKSDDKTALYFSALSFALSAGTKTTAIIAMPVVFIMLVVIANIYKKEQLYKYLLKFSGLFLINFLIFASYNYILNIIQFSNPVSCSEQLLLNQFRGGFKGWLCNLIKYSFAILDASGIRDYINYNPLIMYLQKLVLNSIGETTRSYTTNYFPGRFPFDSTMEFMQSALGIMGLFAFLPSMIKTIKRFIKNHSKIKNIIMFTLTMSLILNIMVFSRVMVFTQYNMRYLLTFVVIASPIAALSYIKRRTIFKILLCIIIFVYFILNTFARPTQYVVSYIKYMKENKTFGVPFLMAKMDETDIYTYLRKNNAKNIGLITEQTTNSNYYIEKLKLSGVHIDKLLLENIEAYRLDEYDYIVSSKVGLASTNIVLFQDRMKYGDLFVSKCQYFDYKQNLITDLNTKPAMIECEVPYEYFAYKGFLPDKNIELKKYTVLKNTNK